jgi:carboxyl-terminal processing protease
MKFLPFPKISLKKLRTVILIIVIIGTSASTGYFFGRKGFLASFSRFPIVTISRQTPPERSVDFSLFWSVWDLLGEGYYDKTKIVDSEMVYGAIKGMTSAIGDPYTVFLTPSESRQMDDDLKGSFEGVGIHIGFKDSQLTVMSPLPGSPAIKAGLQAGDSIIGIKDDLKGLDRGTVGITLPEAVKDIKGPAGTEVTLLVLRNGNEEPLKFDIVRENIVVPSIAVNYVGTKNEIAHIQLMRFQELTAGQWEDAVKEILKRPETSGIILDVRNNGGGYLELSVDIASEFLKTGEVVVIEDSGNEEKYNFMVEKIGRLQNMPIIVLINEGSASASEILAGALRDIKGTLLVGEPSFGKGTIQKRQGLNNGAFLHITTARWLTPSGFWVNEGGLEPDIIIADDIETSEDEQLQEAIRLLISE